MVYAELCTDVCRIFFSRMNERIREQFACLFVIRNTFRLFICRLVFHSWYEMSYTSAWDKLISICRLQPIGQKFKWCHFSKMANRSPKILKLWNILTEQEPRGRENTNMKMRWCKHLKWNMNGYLEKMSQIY